MPEARERAVVPRGLAGREDEDAAVVPDQVVAGVVVRRHQADDVTDLDPEAGQRPVVTRALAEREDEDPAVGAGQVVAVVVVRRHEAHDVVDVDPETGQRAEVAVGLAGREDEDPAVGAGQVVAGRLSGTSKAPASHERSAESRSRLAALVGARGARTGRHDAEGRARLGDGRRLRAGRAVGRQGERADGRRVLRAGRAEVARGVGGHVVAVVGDRDPSQSGPAEASSRIELATEMPAGVIDGVVGVRRPVCRRRGSGRSCERPHVACGVGRKRAVGHGCRISRRKVADRSASARADVGLERAVRDRQVADRRAVPGIDGPTVSAPASCRRTCCR